MNVCLLFRYGFRHPRHTSRILRSNKGIKKGMNPFVYPLIFDAGVWKNLCANKGRIKFTPKRELSAILFSHLCNVFQTLHQENKSVKLNMSNKFPANLPALKLSD